MKRRVGKDMARTRALSAIALLNGQEAARLCVCALKISAPEETLLVLVDCLCDHACDRPVVAHGLSATCRTGIKHKTKLPTAIGTGTGTDRLHSTVRGGYELHATRVYLSN